MPENSVELKRVIMVKAVVTEAFKDNLLQELRRALAGIESQVNAAENGENPSELTKLISARMELQAKVDEVKKLLIGSEFVQGPIEGPVTVAVGDNLYKKIGAAEIVVKDGIVTEIRNNDSPPVIH